MELIGRLTALGAAPVLHLSGEIDLATVPLLRDHLSRATSRHANETLFVDLDGLTAIDDTGFGLLLGAAGRCREQGSELVVVCTNDRLLARLALTGLDRAIRVVSRVHAG
ncbi:MAG: anti-sigma factor antagonist [Actinomycetota bacterium]|nr:anti-sigma factor antagonist [Actinomycetota bacterium]